MPKDTRKKNVQWELPVNSTTGPTPVEAASLAVLMDIRDELQALNALFRCEKFLRIPRELTAIRRNTTKRRNRKTH